MPINLCEQALVILLLPLLAFLVQVFWSRRLPRQGDWVPTLAMFVCLLIASKMFFVDLLGSPGGITRQLWTPGVAQGWLETGGPGSPSGGFRLDFGILVDNLTIVMLFVVTLVSFLVHLYSWGYMHGEERYNRFFAYLALFSFSMLGLCISSNLLFVFVFWELVGLCSYFLIGFYFEKKSASNAAIKAFLTTRIGDLGFFLAILIIASQVGSLNFDDIFRSVAENRWTAGLLTAAGICLFAGAAGKSAQFPLHVWLPDAMEGPTPVSALIHAATMVSAGVYLVARMFPFLAGATYFQGEFWSSPALDTVAMVGGFTAFFAATIAFAQTDIKKVLAYSTVSQLGYMMLGVGVGSVGAGLFHLTTHAFFKALLFLGSGSVIHAVHSNELMDMGGLRRKMPITWITFGIGTLAIAGLPFLSGFYSKEAILTQALASAQHRGAIAWMPFVFGMSTAFMTAFYMFRLFIKTFHGEPRNHHAFEHAHESPWTMTVPLVVLAVFSAAGGGLWGYSDTWFENRVNSQSLTYPVLSAAVLAAEPYKRMLEGLHHAHLTVLGMSLAAFGGGLLGALLFFANWSPLSRRQLIVPGTFLGGLNRALVNLWYVDWFYRVTLVKAVHVLRHLAGFFDKYVIDSLVNLQGHLCRAVAWLVGLADYWGVDGTVRGIGEVTLSGGRKIRRIQSGNLGQYVYTSLLLFAGVLLVSFWMMWASRK
jgi:NADH-quinone oxidoreductase subunit L